MSTHSFGRQVPADLIRLMVATGADDRDKLMAALRAHFAETSNPWNRGKIATVDAWARLAADAGAIELIPVGERTQHRPPSAGGKQTLTVYRYLARLPDEAPPPPKIRLRRATWGQDATPATIHQAVSDGAVNRFDLADWINDLLDGVCHPICPLKAEAWAKLAGDAGAILRSPQKAGEAPYIHRPGENRARFHRYAPGTLPEPTPIVPHGVEACADLLECFRLLPAVVPAVGVGRVHLWDTETMGEAA